MTLAPLRPLVLAAAAAGLAACFEAPPAPPSVPPTQPLARDTPPPTYPEALACEGVGGQVVLQVEIGVDGRPASMRLIGSSGEAELDEAAIAAVRTWEFAPATRNGQPVTSKIQVPMTFTPPTPRPERCFVLDEKSASDLK
jgi:protein TonB